MDEQQQIDQKGNLPEKRRNANQHTINLPPNIIAGLERAADRAGIFATSGPNVGKPSWRAMMRFIGMGFLVVRKPSSADFKAAEKASPEPEKKRTPFRCHPSSPPKFWPADQGVMEREELEAKTKLSPAELEEIGFSLVADGTMWRAPRRWAAWNPVPVVPDWWDDVDGSGACLVTSAPEGADLSAFDRAGDLLMFRREGGGK